MKGMEATGRSRARRLALFLLPAIAFVALLGYGIGQRGTTLLEGDVVPDFSAPLLTGSGELRLSELRGQPVFVNFWWSGCVPCEEEAPLLSAAADRYGDDVFFLGINIRDARSEALAFAAEEDLDFAHVRDEGMDIYRRWGLTGQPESFFIDSDGVLVEHVPGQLDRETLLQFLDVLVARDA
ncbi:MAG: redoxin domain-containing protein [Actinobacteria bacterium]|nr:redoxin domain-containing protein [Actinomycetota bacterium]